MNTATKLGCGLVLALLVPLITDCANAATKKDGCASYLESARGKFKLAHSNLDNSDSSSTDFSDKMSGAFESEFNLAFVEIACGDPARAFDLAEDLNSQDPGNSKAALLDVLYYLHKKDLTKLDDFYAHRLTHTARGPTVASAYYYDLTLLLLDKTLCRDSTSAVPLGTCTRKSNLVFGDKMPASVQLSLQSIFDGKSLTTEDLRQLPAEFRPTKKLLLYLESTNSKSPSELLDGYALDESGYQNSN